MTDTNSHPTELRVLFLKRTDSPFDGLVHTIQTVLDQKFHVDSQVLSDPLRLSPVYYNLLPHFLVFDSQFQKMIEKIKLGENAPNELTTVPVLNLQEDGQTDLENQLFITVYERLQPGASEELVGDRLESVISQLGFEMKHGKINDRLVQRSLNVEISVDEVETTLSGETTGINPNGLGARVNFEDPSLSSSEKIVDQLCTVHFNDMDLGFMPAEGKILRVEESWDDEHDAFVAVRFNPNVGFSSDPKTQDILDSLIDQQDDQSIRKSGEVQRES